MSRLRHLRTALRHPGFRRLYATRLLGQFGDGVFQASLAGAVLFNPERQAHAADIAAGFAVLLIPYSVVGPFAGVLLDRWSRQRTLALANVVRALSVLVIGAELLAGLHGQPFYASALIVVSVNRFVLSALSASLPHVVPTSELVTANAFSTTSGGVATTVGGGLAIAARVLLGSTDTAYGVMAMGAAIPYVAAAWSARGFGHADLGPDDAQRACRETAAEVARGLAAGARHIRDRPAARNALAAIGVHRLCYGITTVSLLMLYRNYFHDDGVFRAGLAGLGQIVAAVAAGGVLAALVTPPATRAIGYVRWITLNLVLSAAIVVGLGLTYQVPLLVLASFVLGFTAQSIKICVDTTVQRSIEDEFRGRVFSLYDSLFNITLVAAATVTALALPESGHAPVSIVVVGCGFLATAAIYGRTAARLTPALQTTA